MANPDGVRITRRPGGNDRVLLLLLAVGILGVALTILVRLVVPPAADAVASAARVDDSRQNDQSAPPTSIPTAAPGTVRIHPVPRRVHTTPALADPATPAATGPTPDIPGPHPGIAIYPPPGTDPPKPGVIVPDDFVLPEGYLRHHQTTDDGQQLPPILMFHPDYEWVDADGRAIALPADRVVPAELAPPGLAVEILHVPKTNVPAVHHEDGTPFQLPPR